MLKIKIGEEYNVLSGEWDEDRMKGVVNWETKSLMKKSVGFFEILKDWTIQMEGFGLITFRNGDNYAGDREKKETDFFLLNFNSS
jgi:hypothetical protein